MTTEIETGTILIKHDAVLPKGLAIKSEFCMPDWKIVADFDGYGLDREIHRVGWNFFCIAAVVRATVFGIDGQKMVRRAIERILRSPKMDGFNSLEIAQLARVGSVRFPGIWLVRVAAYPRHIQESLFLFSAKNLAARESQHHDIRNQETGLASGKTLRAADARKQTAAAPILSL